MTFNAAVIGSPINHSLSPLIHNTAYSLLKYDGHYARAEVKSGDLQEFLLGAAASKISGLSVTAPLKEEAYDVAVSHDSNVENTKSVNTLIRFGDGWSAFNTDVIGLEVLMKSLGYVKNENRTAVILGGGGTARSALAAASRFGQRIVYRRSPERDALLKAVDTDVEIRSWDSLSDGLASDLLISTVPSSAIDFDLGKIVTDGLIDAIYSPWIPPLTKRFQEESIPVANGLDLLLAQALEQIALMTKVNFDREELTQVIRPLLISAAANPQAS